LPRVGVRPAASADGRVLAHVARADARRTPCQHPQLGGAPHRRGADRARRLSAAHAGPCRPRASNPARPARSTARQV